MNGVAANTNDGFEVRYMSPAGGYSHTYTYDKDVMEYIPADILVLSTKGYERKPPKVGAVVVIILVIALIVFYNVRKKKRLREFAARMEEQLRAEENSGQGSQQDIFFDQR